MVRQFIAVCSVIFSGLKSRIGSAIVAVIAIACVVGVLIVVQAMGLGYRAMLEATGQPDRAIVISKGGFESSSNISRDAAFAIAQASPVRRDADGNAMASMEMLAQVRLSAKKGNSVAVTVRGVGTEAARLRPEIHVVQGRMFRPGLRELVVGKALQSRVTGLEVGDLLTFQDAAWRIVGEFSGGQNGGIHDSEILGDANVLMPAFHRAGFQSVVVQLAGSDSLGELNAFLEANPSMTAEAHDERQYYADRSKTISQIFATIGTFISGIMAIGALFAAASAMYTAMADQIGLIATLRAIGYRPASVLVAVTLESLLLAVAGAIVGAAVAAILFDGRLLSVAPGGQSQNYFTLHVTPMLAFRGALWAIVIGVLGGLPPALRAARVDVATALRAT